jgi:hypothetical protein
VRLPKWLTYTLVLHIVTLVLAFFASIVGLAAHRREWSTTTVTSSATGLAALASFLAFIFDIAIWLVAKSRNSLGAAPGVGLWLNLATWIILTLAACLFGVARRTTAARRAKKDPQYGSLPMKEEKKKKKQSTLKSKKSKKQANASELHSPLQPAQDGPSGSIPAAGAGYQPSPGRAPGHGHVPTRSEGGLPAFGERTTAGNGQGLPAFPEYQVIQEEASAPATVRARIEGDEVVLERQGLMHSPVSAPQTPRTPQTPQQPQFSGGYVPGVPGQRTIDDFNRPPQPPQHPLHPQRQGSGHSAVTYGVGPAVPEHIIPRRQGSDPQSAQQFAPQRQGSGSDRDPVHWAPAPLMPPVPPLPASLQYQQAPFQQGPGLAQSQMPETHVDSFYGQGQGLGQYQGSGQYQGQTQGQATPSLPNPTGTPPLSLPMPAFASHSSRRQASDPAYYAQTPGELTPGGLTPGGGPNGPGMPTWGRQDTVYYTPGSTFHQQAPSTPAGMMYGQPGQHGQYGQQGQPSPQPQTPRGYGEYNPYASMQAPRQSYYTPPAFSSDPYDPNGLQMPTGYLSTEPLPMVPHPNEHISSSPAMAGAATNTSDAPPLPSKPKALHDEQPNRTTWSLPSNMSSQDSLPPPLPAKPGSPDSIHTQFKSFSPPERTSRLQQGEGDDDLPAYEDPMGGPSGTRNA